MSEAFGHWDLSYSLMFGCCFQVSLLRRTQHCTNISEMLPTENTLVIPLFISMECFLFC